MSNDTYLERTGVKRERVNLQYSMNTVACDRNLDFFDAQRLILVPTCSLGRGLSENVNKKIQPSGTF